MGWTTLLTAKKGANATSRHAVRGWLLFLVAMATLAVVSSLAACGGGGGGGAAGGGTGSAGANSSTASSLASSALSGGASSTGASSSSAAASSAAASSSASLAAGTLSAPLAFAEQPFGSLTLVDEIDTANVAPSAEYPTMASAVQSVLGKNARVLAPGSTARYVTYRIGAGKGLVAKQAYVLDIEYPDDVPRAMFVANRGADFIRGFTTGSAVGDSRRAWTLSTLESLAFPQSGAWKNYRSLFYLHERFSAVAQRNSICSTRPLLPADGFDVSVFQSRQLNDPRSNGAAVGKIRLYRVDSVASLPATINYPGSLPRRHLFWREEMADEAVSNADATKRATSSAIDWFGFKMDMGRALGFNTVGKDMMEWGYNQGFDGGDSNWILNAQPPLTSIWSQIVSTAASKNLYVMPYLEYGGSLGYNCMSGQPCDKTSGNYKSLGFQRRTRKLYHGLYGPGGNKENYTGVWWTEDKSADLTDPDTSTDLRRVLDKITMQYKGSANFAGVWLRMRQTKLPMSFSAETIARYNADNSGSTRTLSQLQTDVSSRQAYYDWWYGKRRSFLQGMRDYVRTGMADSSLQVLFSAYPGEPTPEAYAAASSTSLLYLVTDDTNWWTTYSSGLNATTDPDGFYKYKWSNSSFTSAVSGRMHKLGLEKTWVPAENAYTHDWEELTHSAPPADPLRYASDDGVAMTYEFGKALYTVADSALLGSYSNAAGQSLVHHFPLNEDNGNVFSESYNVANCTGANRYAITADEPFDGKLGYMSVAVERSGPFTVLAEARSLANGNPINIAYLESSSMSRGFPAYVRRFNQALLSLPAMPMTTASGMSSDANVVVRQISTGSGTYYAVINPTMATLNSVLIDFGAGTSSIDDRIAGTTLTARKLQLDLYPGEVRTFRIP